MAVPQADNDRLWTTVVKDDVVPSLFQVQSEMSVPRESRVADSPEGKIYPELVEVFTSLVCPKGAVVNVSHDEELSSLLFSDSGDSVLHSRYLAAESRFLFLATIGSAVEEEASRCLSCGEYLKGCILDAMASAAVELVVDTLQKQASLFVGAPCVRFSPGYGGWNLSVQEFFLRFFQGEAQGLSLNDSFMFTPHKTVSGVIVPRDSPAVE